MYSTYLTSETFSKVLYLSQDIRPWNGWRHLPAPPAEAWVQSKGSPGGFCGGESGTGTGLVTSTPVFRCRYHSANVPYISFVYYRGYVMLATDSVVE